MTTSDNTLDLIERMRAKGESFCVATILRTADSTSARPGAKAVITLAGVLHGFVGGACVTGAVRRGALECLDSAQPKMIRVKPKDEVVTALDVDGVQLHRSSCPSGGTIEVFLEPMRSARTLAICGASPIAQAVLCLAKGMAYRIIVAAAVDEQEKMAGASAYLNDFSLEELALTSDDAVIVATQGKQDRNALRAVLQCDAGYKGMVCSRRKRAALTQQLVGENTDIQSSLAQLHAPAGIHIGAIEPEEIALSVIAEIVAYQRLGVRPVDETVFVNSGTA